MVQTQDTNLLVPRVLDRTGLTGKYSFSLDYSPPGAITGPDDSAADLPDLVVALRKQLGLDLNKIAGVPVDVIVVDSVDNVPHRELTLRQELFDYVALHVCQAEIAALEAVG